MKNGYSLIELVVTITVMTILAAIAIPYFRQSDVDASWFNEQAKAAVRYAQRQAVAQRRSVFVNVTTTAIRVCYDSGCGSPVPRLGGEIWTPGPNPAPAAGTDYSLTVPAGVSVTTASFSFNGLGQPNPIAGVSFTAGSAAVTVTAETGYVQ
jgi:MSHA pilin protein MshC